MVGGAALHYVKPGCAAIGGEPGVPQGAKAKGDPGRGDEMVVDACLLGAVALPETRDRHALGVNRQLFQHVRFTHPFGQALYCYGIHCASSGAVYVYPARARGQEVRHDQPGRPEYSSARAWSSRPDGGAAR